MAHECGERNVSVPSQIASRNLQPPAPRLQPSGERGVTHAIPMMVPKTMIKTTYLAHLKYLNREAPREHTETPPVRWQDV